MHPEDEVNPVLRHPWLALKSSDSGEFAGRVRNITLGGALGATAGLGAGYAAVRAFRNRPQNTFLHEMAQDPMHTIRAGVTTGSMLGGAVPAVANAFDQLMAHHRAAVDHEQQTGQSLPFAVRHPFLLAGAPPLAGAALGAALAGKGLLARGVGGAAGLTIGTLVGTPFTANYGADARAAYFDRNKQASDVNPILLHPTLVKRPTTPEEAEERGRHYANYVAGGAMLGTLGGGAAAFHYGPKLMENFMRGPGALGGAALGAITGAMVGTSGGYLHRYAKAVKEHDEAARQYEAQSGEKLTFSVRHPHALVWGPLAAGAAAGVAMPAAGKAERAFNSLMGVGTAALSLAPLGAAYAYKQRKDKFGGRVGPLSTQMYGSDFDSDTMTLKQREEFQQAQQAFS
jgi:hypothetical protein